MNTLDTLEKLALIALAFALAVGSVGSLLELIGNVLKRPWLVKLGQKLEAVGADIPKLLGKSAPAALLFFLPLAACASQTERCLTAADVAHHKRVHKQCKGYPWVKCPKRPALLETYDQEQNACRPPSLN